MYKSLRRKVIGLLKKILRFPQLRNYTLYMTYLPNYQVIYRWQVYLAMVKHRQEMRAYIFKPHREKSLSSSLKKKYSKNQIHDFFLTRYTSIVNFSSNFGWWCLPRSIRCPRTTFLVISYQYSLKQQKNQPHKTKII